MKATGGVITLNESCGQFLSSVKSSARFDEGGVMGVRAICPNTSSAFAGEALGGGLGSRERAGRPFLGCKTFSRYSSLGSFTDCLYSGTVSTMADTSTAKNAKQLFFKPCSIGWGAL